MFDTILFDLDGTLLPIETDLFTKKYFEELSKKLQDYFTPEEVMRHMWKSTEHMINRDDKNKTNKDAFFEHFYKNINHSGKDLNPLLEDFYKKDFNNVSEIGRQNKDMIKSVNLLKEKGYNLVVVSNPVFPRSAMIDRLRWAGFDEEDFCLVVGFEDMHFAKPSLEFYKEVLEKIDKKPTQCLMVGNDVDDDMVSHELGIKTYLIEDFAKGDKGNRKNIDFSGSYSDFYEFSQSLPKVNKL